jgi:hypothetical protein
VAASLVGVEGLVLLLLSVLELGSLSAGRVAMGVTTTAFFVVCGVALVFCGWAVSRGQSWARSPIVLTQLIQLGVAWSFRGGSTTLVAIVLALLALVVIAGVLHPASIEALSDDHGDPS